MNADNLQGFKIIGCRLNDKTTANHELFIKENSNRNHSEDKPPSRTLFLANVPPWATEQQFKQIFTKFAGPVQSVSFQRTSQDGTPQPAGDGFKCAFVVFEKSADLRLALGLEGRTFNFRRGGCIADGLSEWVSRHNAAVTGQETLRQRVRRVIERYDETEAKRIKSKAGSDEEGWTLVTKKSRKPGGSRTESRESKANAKRKRREDGLKDFYTFQIKQGKMNEIATLRRKHEEDKKKVEAIRRARKFKPY